MLELRPSCEHCNKPLPPDSLEARICSYECTFCATCVDDVLQNVCPNCGGGFVPRPIRPARAGSAYREPTMTRRLISSGSTFEDEIGYSRAVVDGDWVFVSGTTGFAYATMSISDGLLDQTEQCLKNIDAALGQAGSSLADVVRVTYILPDASEFSQCWPVLRKYFGDVRPAATMIAAGLADPRMRIEIEVTARKRSADAVE